MSLADSLWSILKEEYGISTIQELEEAIKNQKRLDITAFCMGSGRSNGSYCVAGTERA